MSALPKVKQRQALPPAEARTKQRLVGVVNRRLKNFIEVGTALTELRDLKLYRDEFDSFDEFTQTYWGFGKAQAYRMISAADVDKALPDDLPRPTSECATRPLQKIPAEYVEPVYRDAVEANDGRAPSGPQVAAAAERVVPAPLRARLRRPSDPVEAARESGLIPEGAEVRVETPDVIDVSPRGDSGPAPDAPQTDAEWLATLPARGELSERCRATFDVEALAYRSLADARDAYRDACRKVTKPAIRELGFRGPWLARHGLHLLIQDPSDWVACSPCGGAGVRPIVGACPDCHGHGYHVR